MTPWRKKKKKMKRKNDKTDPWTEKLWKGKRKVVRDGNDGIDGGAWAAYNRSSNSSSHPPWPSPCSEGRKWRKRENHSDNSASTSPHNAQQHRKRETEEQPDLAFSVDGGHPSSALFIRPFFQKYIQSPQSSSLIRTLHSFFLPEEHPDERPVASEFTPHSHSSSILSSGRTSARLRIHPSSFYSSILSRDEDQPPQSSSYIRTLHPSFILNEYQSPPRGVLLTEFIPHPYSSSIISRRTSVGYSQHTCYQSSSLICTLHPSCRRRSVALEFILHLHSSLHSFQKIGPFLAE